LWEGNCYLPFSWDAQFDNHPMSLKIDSMETSCADQRYILHTSASGKSPWYLSYTFNGDTTISLLNQAVDTLQLVAGKYHFIATDDANFCHLFMDRSDTLNSFLTQNPAITLQNHQLVSNVSDVEHQWFKNDTLLVNETTNAITVQGNGSYYCRLQDDAGCVYQSNIYTVNFDEDIQVFPNPVHQTLYIAVNDVFDFWEYEIHDMFGNRLTQGVSEKANLSLDVSHYQSGTYLIHFKKNGQKSVFRFTKL
jgi:hypothetical protein